jgi:hypothetical protein
MGCLRHGILWVRHGMHRWAEYSPGPGDLLDSVHGPARGAVTLWVWVLGAFDEWSGRLPMPGYFAWLLGSTALGAAVGWILHEIRLRGFAASPNSIWFEMAFMGSLVGSPVTTWRT